MQEQNRVDVKKILTDLAEHLNVRGIRALSVALGESENKLYAWIKRGSIADTGAILGKCPEINAQWLIGESDTMIRPSASFAGLTDGLSLDEIETIMIKKMRLRGKSYVTRMLLQMQEEEEKGGK